MYFDKYGASTLIISRFLPVIRTFAPILAGLILMPFWRFMFNNILGATAWVVVLTGSGFYFGRRYPWIVDYVQWIIVFFLAVTTFTVIRGYINARRG